MAVVNVIYARPLEPLSRISFAVGRVPVMDVINNVAVRARFGGGKVQRQRGGPGQG